MDLAPIEQQALALLLDRDDEGFQVLRQQAEVASVVSREFSGVGFFTELSVPPDAPHLPDGTSIDPITGVGADIAGLQHGAGFVLFLAEGRLEMLEGFTYDEPWPDSYESFSVFHLW